MEYCAIDLETTGVNPYRDAICEIGMLRFDYEKGSVTKSFASLVNPCRAMPPEVCAIHGITDEMLADAPLEADILDNVLAFIDSCPLVIQNPRFDLSFLQIAFKKAGKTFSPDIVYDTVSLAKYVYPDIKNHKLETVCRHLNIDLSFHRALDDAKGCMQIFLDACKQLFGSKIKETALAEICGFSCRDHLLQKLAISGALKPENRYYIEYRDRDGKQTQREILVHDLFKLGKKIIVHAWCYLRNEERFFNYERIKKIRGIEITK